jgi:hypothetical protein
MAGTPANLLSPAQVTEAGKVLTTFLRYRVNYVPQTAAQIMAARGISQELLDRICEQDAMARHRRIDITWSDPSNAGWQEKLYAPVRDEARELKREMRHSLKHQHRGP